MEFMKDNKIRLSCKYTRRQIKEKYNTKIAKVIFGIDFEDKIFLNILMAYY